MENLNNMKCEELRKLAKSLGIKEYGSKGKGWLIPMIEQRLEEKRRIEEAIQMNEAKEKAKKQAKEMKVRNVNLIEHNGKAQSLGAWAKELGMPEPTLRARLRSGWTIEQALAKESSRKTEKLIEFNGKSQSLTAWAKELGLPRATLNARINRFNWPLEKALAARPQEVQA